MLVGRLTVRNENGPTGIGVASDRTRATVPPLDLQQFQEKRCYVEWNGWSCLVCYDEHLTFVNIIECASSYTSWLQLRKSTNKYYVQAHNRQTVWSWCTAQSLFRRREQLRSIVTSTSVCLSVCSWGYFRNYMYMRDLYQLFVHVAYGHGSVSHRRSLISTVALLRIALSTQTQANVTGTNDTMDLLNAPVDHGKAIQGNRTADCPWLCHLVTTTQHNVVWSILPHRPHYVKTWHCPHIYTII